MGFRKVITNLASLSLRSEMAYQSLGLASFLNSPAIKASFFSATFTVPSRSLYVSRHVFAVHFSGCARTPENCPPDSSCNSAAMASLWNAQGALNRAEHPMTSNRVSRTLSSSESVGMAGATFASTGVSGAAAFFFLPASLPHRSVNFLFAIAPPSLHARFPHTISRC